MFNFRGGRIIRPRRTFNTSSGPKFPKAKIFERLANGRRCPGNVLRPHPNVFVWPPYAVEMTDEPVEMADEHVEMPDEHVEMPDEHIKVSNEHVELSHEHMEATDEHVEMTDEHVWATAEDAGRAGGSRGATA